MLIVDLIVVAILLAYGWFGYRSGFINQIVELLGFVGSFLVALVAYPPIGSFIGGLTKLPDGLSDLIGLLGIWFIIEVSLALLWQQLRHRVPEHLQKSSANRLSGIMAGLLKGGSLLIIILLILASATLPAATKDPILKAGLTKPLVGLGAGLQQQINQVFGGAFQDTLAFKTIKTQGDESVALGFTAQTGRVDPAAEGEMVSLMNLERTKRGLPALVFDPALREVGRRHSQDMLARGYFSHNTPEGLTPFDRMEQAGITYEFAGENLALAPTVEIAMNGLMNSPGHRANILSPDFRRIGVGSIDAGVRGKMFSQEFKG